MNKTFLARLALDFVAAGLLLIGLAYYWLDNTAHELIGTAMFLLIIAHNIFNRRWYGTIAKGRRGARSLINLAITLSLLIAMVALLITSVMISRAVFGFLAPDGGFTAHQIHALAAYWVLVIVSIHLGLRWETIMSALRGMFGVATNSQARTTVLRVIAAAIAIHGVRSSFELGIGSRLTLQRSLDWWDFGESTFGFFLHAVSIVGLYVILAHYVMKWIQGGKRRTTPALAILADAAPCQPRKRSASTSSANAGVVCRRLG